jgi:hypothetical protein
MPSGRFGFQLCLPFSRSYMNPVIAVSTQYPNRWLQKQMFSRDEIDIEIDLGPVQRAAGRVREMLTGLRQRYNLAPFEYTRRVRIAPTEIPHSHPVLTLNSFERDDVALLSTYLHEQMHWYLTWYSKSRASAWETLFARPRARYPRVPAVADGVAQDECSTYLHVLVNWCEVEAASQFVERNVIMQHVGSLPFYRRIYRTVLDDWDELGALYRESVWSRCATRPTCLPTISRWLVSEAGSLRLPAFRVSYPSITSQGCSHLTRSYAFDGAKLYCDIRVNKRSFVLTCFRKFSARVGKRTDGTNVRKT